jgi:hypothetical protein
MAVTLYLELWRALPDLPGPDLRQAARWTKMLIAEARSLGAPSPIVS